MLSAFEAVGLAFRSAFLVGAVLFSANLAWVVYDKCLKKECLVNV